MPGIDFELDKLHEECGVFGIYSHKDDVALNTYWGLYALQHRGQESTGIVTTDGSNMQVTGTTWKTTFRRQTWRTCEDSGLLPHSWEVKRMASISVSLDRNADRHDVKLLKRELDTLPGVTSVSVSSGGQLAVDYDATGVRQADILEKIQALGYHVRQEHA